MSDDAEHDALIRALTRERYNLSATDTKDRQIAGMKRQLKDADKLVAATLAASEVREKETARQLSEVRADAAFWRAQVVDLQQQLAPRERLRVVPRDGA